MRWKASWPGPRSGSRISEARELLYSGTMRSSLATSQTDHELSQNDKEDHQRKLRREGVDLLKQGRATDRRERENRARNISRAASKRQP